MSSKSSGIFKSYRKTLQRPCRVFYGPLLILLLTLLIFAALFASRSADDNRLTSWAWTLDGTNIGRVSFLLAAGALLAFALSHTSLHGRRPAAFLFVFSFAAAAVFWREPEVIIDASRYFTQAKDLEVYGIGYFFREWGKGISAWTDLPAVPFLYGLLFKFFGESRIVIQAFTTFLFSSTVVLTYLIGKTLWDEETGFLAGMLLLGMPYLYSQVPLMLVDIPSTAFLTFAVFAFLTALGRGGMWIALSALAVVLVLFSKYSAWLMLSVLIIAFLVYPKTANPGAVLSRGALILLSAVLFSGIVFYLKFDVISDQMRFLVSYQKPGLRRWGESYISTFLFQVHPFITAAACYSAYAAVRRRDWRYLVAGWLVLLILLLQIKRIRYTIPVFPMLALMASYGLSEIRTKELKRLIALCAVSSSLVIAAAAYLPFLERMSIVNVKNAGEYLDTRPEKEIEVIALAPKDSVINPAVYVPILDLFTRKGIYYHYESDFMPPKESIKTSPLRFTWEYRVPEYYASYREKSGELLAVISGGPDDIVPEYVRRRLKGYSAVREFRNPDEVFTSQSFVTIYQKRGDRSGVR